MCSIPIIREIPWDEPMQCGFPFPVDKTEASLYPSSHPWFSSFSLCLSVCLFLTPSPYRFQFISKSCWLVLSKCFQIYPLLILSTFPILVVLCSPPAQTITAASSLVLTLVCLPHTEIRSLLFRSLSWLPFHSESNPNPYHVLQSPLRAGPPGLLTSSPSSPFSPLPNGLLLSLQQTPFCLYLSGLLVSNNRIHTG